jgi:hypothetical protein
MRKHMAQGNNDLEKLNTAIGVTQGITGEGKGIKSGIDKRDLEKKGKKGAKGKGGRKKDEDKERMTAAEQKSPD